jgi:hypothetical protein
MGVIGIVKDLLIVYVGIRLILVFVFGLQFNTHIFLLLLVLFVLGLMGLLQRIGVIPRL